MVARCVQGPNKLPNNITRSPYAAGEGTSECFSSLPSLYCEVIGITHMTFIEFLQFDTISCPSIGDILEKSFSVTCEPQHGLIYAYTPPRAVHLHKPLLELSGPIKFVWAPACVCWLSLKWRKHAGGETYPKILLFGKLELSGWVCGPVIGNIGLIILIKIGEPRTSAFRAHLLGSTAAPGNGMINCGHTDLGVNQHMNWSVQSKKDQKSTVTNRLK